jgi:outer membrane protein TolC
MVPFSVPGAALAQYATTIPSAGGVRTTADVRQATDSLPRMGLTEALRRAAQVDPDYVAALRQVGDAEWVRRQARSAFIIPSIAFQYSWNRYSSEQFNFGTGEFTDELTQASLGARYDLFRGGAKIFDVRGANADVEGAQAGELQARFATALGTEADYYDVIAQTELLRVARERVRRAEQQLAVARARVVSGAAVQTDSLQLVLELTRARVDQLRQESLVTVSRLQLGRRVGVPGPVDAVPLDTLPAGPLPITETEAREEAIRGSPRVQVSRADARVANEAFKAERSSYLPTLSLFGQWTGFDDALVPTATTRTSYGVALSFPIWDGAEREISVYRANTRRKVAEAERLDAEREVARDIIGAYQAYETARASTELAAHAVVVARENLRVQEERYQAGATTIIELITAQVALTEAEAGLVQARFTTRLALAAVEAILGRRVFAK